jgi:5-methylcytosine-specific restriction endonuclease McrA
MVRKRLYIAGKSGDSWYQLPHSVRQKYKITLSRMYGSKCNTSYGRPVYRNTKNKSSKVGCGRPFPLALLTVDHIIPISKGGPVFDIGNMQLLCWECHRKKTTENDMIDV